MTSPNSVGAVSIEVLGSAKDLVKNVRKDFEQELHKLDLRRLIKEAAGSRPITVPVKADVDADSLKEQFKKAKASPIKVPLDPDTKDIPEKVKRTKVPPVKVPVDPLIQAFQQDVRDSVRRISRQAVKIPVNANTESLRRELSATLTEIRAQSKIKVPVEPEAKAAYEARLRAQLAEVSRRVKQHVDIEVDKGSTGGVIGGIGKLLSGLTSALPGLGRLSSGLSDVTGSLQKLSGTSAQAGGSIAGAFSSAAGPIGAVAAATVAAGVALTSFGAAAAGSVPVLGAIAAGLVAVAGAAAAIPAALAGAGAAVATLGLGFSGIADAFKKQPKTGGSGGGGGAGEDQASRARRIAAAERGVTAARRGIAAATRGVQSAARGYADAELRLSQAQDRAKSSQAAINRARHEAAESIDDLNRSLRGAQLEEEDAALRVTEALRALNEAKETGVLPDISRADLEYRQAIQSLEEAKDTTSDLGKESAEANAKGVEGSSQVKDALQDQADALQAVKDAQRGLLDAQDSVLGANESLAASYDGLKAAQDSLAEAQKKAASAGGGGGGGLAADVIKLAPAAQKFVNAIKALKPAYERLRLAVQQSLFAGLDKTVTRVANAYEGPLTTTLVNYAKTFNRFAKDLGSAVIKPKFITDLQTGAEGARSGLEKIGKSITSSLVPAFGALSAAAGPFLAKLGEEIAGVVTEFSNFILQAEKTGKLEEFFDKATEAMHDLFTTTKQVGRLIGNVFRVILNGGGANSGKSGIDSFNDGLEKINQFFEDPKNQQRIQDFIADLKQVFETFKSSFNDAKGFLDKILPDSTSGSEQSSSLGAVIGKALVAGIFAGIQAGLRIQAGLIIDVLTGPGSFVDGVRHGFGIASPSKVFATIGKQLIAGLVNGIKDRLSALAQRARDITRTVVNAFTGAGKFLYNSGRNVVAGLVNGMISLYGTVRARVAGLRSTITGALSNAGSLLIRIGRAVINGLKEGIRQAIPALGSLLGTVGRFIQDNKGPIEKDRVLLKPAGRAIMDGLIGGIGDRQGALAAKLSDVTTLVAGTSFDSLGSAGDAALTSSLSAHAEQRVLLDIAPGVSGDWFRDGLKRNIKLVYNGNVGAALGT